MKALPKTLTVVLTALLLLAAGCATKNTPKNYIVFPSPPEEPRIQYLMSYGSEAELGSRGKFSEFLLGAEQVHRPITKPYGVTMQKGVIYVCDTQAGNVSMADIAKHKMRYLKPAGQAGLKVPINVAVDKDGTVYVTDSGRAQVLVFNKDGVLIEAMGARGEMQPCGVALGADRLYVTDLTNHCVRVYSKPDRKLLFTVPRNSTNENSRLSGPTNVAVDQQGRIYVSDTRGFTVKIYDAQGEFLRATGDLGVTPGQFTLPKGVAADHEGRFYVVDAASAVVQLFDPEGKLLLFFGDSKSSGDAGLYLPAGISINYEDVGLFQSRVMAGYKLEYLILLTNQVGPNKVSVYGLLKKG